MGWRPQKENDGVEARKRRNSDEARRQKNTCCERLHNILFWAPHLLFVEHLMELKQESTKYLLPSPAHTAHSRALSLSL